jgi:two-component sensor histidine kinase
VKATGEIGDLAESMNRMVESLEQSNVKLRDSMKSTASLREKEILLREIHHRVKNNMQILTSLLRLQTRQADSQELREVLQESEARIRSMGLLHEKLYQSESVSVIDMHGYLRTLTGELTRMNTPRGTRREIKLNVHGVGMGLDTALPCGLIITELVTNALKYAFPSRDEGIIYVSLGALADGSFQLVVWDNGIGMDENFDINKASSLGMRLVRMLTDQLNGSLAFDCSRGTRITVTFRESQYELRL